MLRIWQIGQLASPFMGIKAGTEVLATDETQDGITAEIGPWDKDGKPTAIMDIPFHFLTPQVLDGSR